MVVITFDSWTDWLRFLFVRVCVGESEVKTLPNLVKFAIFLPMTKNFI